MKRPGRPKGTRNRTYRAVRESVVLCPYCGSAKRSRKRSYRPIRQRSGDVTRVIRRSRVRCLDCRRVYQIFAELDA